MSIGLVGKKCGMTRVFTEEGIAIPVTVIEVLPNRVTQIKTEETDGYSALQVAAIPKKASHITQAATGHFAKAGVEASRYLKEFRVEPSALANFKLGDELTVDLFEQGQKVDVRGVSKGKGFAGVIKRHNFKSQRASHGNSLSHRAPGSVGMCQTPGRVLKGKRMAGHMGNVNTIAQNQLVVRVDKSRHLILVQGAVPGAPGGRVIITSTTKTKKKKGE